MPGRRRGNLVVGLALALALGSATRSAGASPAGPGGDGDDARPTPPPAPFTDVTEEAGVTFVHSNGAAGEKLLPETMGGGVAFVDYDGDGDPDLLFVDSAGEHTGGRGVVLYRNDGGGRFRDVTDASGLGEAVRADPEDPYGAFYGMGAAAADYDGDGWVDLYLTAVGPNRLLRNRWGVFEDVTEAAGAAGAPGREDAWSTGAAFFDADGDGDLDLVVGNYLEWSPELDRSPDMVAERTVAAASRVRPCHTADGCDEVLTYGRPQTYRGVHPFLFVNRGDGTFREAGRTAGLHVEGYASGEPVAKALAVAPLDVDGDGRTDLFVANDTTRNLLFHNRGPGDDGRPRFEEVGELWGLAYDPDGNTTGAMGVDWGHLGGGTAAPGNQPGSEPGPEAGGRDGDGEGNGNGDAGAARRSPPGDLSVAVGNFADEPTSLYTAQGDPTFFADEALGLGLAAPTRRPLTFGLLMLDYDLDARLDLLQANGHVEPDIAQIDRAQTYRQPGQLFRNAAEAEPAGGASRAEAGTSGSPGAAADSPSGGNGPDSAAADTGRGVPSGPASRAGPRLVEVPEEHLGDLARPLAGRGATYADVDLDGDPDLVLTQIAGAPLLLRNDRDADSGVLAVRLRGSAPNRQALGAIVELRTAGATQRRELQPARSYLSQVEAAIRFGPGRPAGADGAESPTSLRVIWPGAGRESPARRELRRLDLLPLHGRSRTLVVVE
ncbi:MAG: CRTAC1 family protein [Thermoanaerobaculia bacterium]